MAKPYPLKWGRFNHAMAALLVLLGALVAAEGCRLPAREWRWEVNGAEKTWLEGLGEGRACGLSLRVWVADRTLWPLPLPGSRRLFFGADDLDLLILVDNERDRDAPFAPARVLLRVPETAGARAPARADAGCPDVAPAGERIACTLAIAAPRGEENLTLDLTDALACHDAAFVFGLTHHASWAWRRVGPGVPGL